MQPSTNQSDQTIDSTATTVNSQMDAKQQQLAHLAQDIRFRMKRSTEDLIQIGTNLIEAKKLCEHGEWLPWLEREFTGEYALTNRTAQHYMNVAQKFGDKCETVSYLPIAATALYMLSATSVPDEARVEAITRAAAGETISKKKANQIIQQYTSIAAETAALGESLGLPTQGDSVLPDSDRIDDLTHTSPADVDDRPLAPPTQPQPALSNYVAGDRITTDYSLKGEVGKIVRVLDTSALVDWGSHTIEIPFERLRPAPAKQPNLPPISYDGKDESESDSKLQSQPNLTSSDAVTPTPAQWQAAQVKHVELLQALRDAQTEIEQLTAENLKLHEAKGDLHSEIAHLKEELAALKAQLQP